MNDEEWNKEQTIVDTDFDSYIAMVDSFIGMRSNPETEPDFLAGAALIFVFAKEMRKIPSDWIHSWLGAKR